MLYWPEFEFNFRLDIQKLLPHMAAIEAFQNAASNRVLPSAWRERPEPATGDGELAPVDLSGQPAVAPNPTDIRKHQLRMRNGGTTQAWVRERFLPGSAPLSLADIFTMHRMVADETGVRYQNENGLRVHGVMVGRREVGGLHTGAPPEKLPALMEGYVQFINSSRLRCFPPVVHALVSHFFFTTIHPLDDGNGRVSRLISAAILFQREYHGHGYYALSHYFYQNAVKYHSLLHQCWQQPLPFDLTTFVAFGMEGVALELQGISNFLKMKLDRAVERQMLPRASHNKRTLSVRGRRLSGMRSGRKAIVTAIATLFWVLGLAPTPMMMANQAGSGPGITATVSPDHPTAGVTKVSITGQASVAATVTDTSTFPDGTVHIFSFKADSHGAYTDGPFVLQQLGTYHDVLQDRATGASISITYTGLGDFSLAVSPATRTVARGETATYTVIFTSVSGFVGDVTPAARDRSHIPGATAWWSNPFVSVPPRSSATTTFLIRTSKSTPRGTYRSITLVGMNGSVAHALPSKISLTVK
ncbi:MAG TPA: Fic family protein [Verrucomicrobiae bacterium]|nr:Fic family protein [Verrucomicrobiae bacterium]